MITIPAAFQQYKQFITWQEQDRGKPKLAKVPISRITGKEINPLNPANWITADDALSSGYGVGFVFTERDPFFFLDIDDALIGSDWSELAKTLCYTFTGSYIEISHNRKGLHIFGTGVFPEHSCKNKSANLEFYTKNRFVALTGNNAVGDALYNPQTSIDWLINAYFKAIPENRINEIWTTEPVPEWNGITNDDKLIEKMLKSKSASAAFSGRASVAELWSGNTENYGGDHSNADAALCQHLAFWTGKNCGRMDKLFRKSGLMRPKWDEQRGKYTYGVKTIFDAVGKCNRVFKERQIIDGCHFRDGFQFKPVDQQVEYFKGCVYVSDIHRIFTPKGQFLKPDQFKVTYGGWMFALDTTGEAKLTPCAYQAFTQNQGYDFPKVDTTCFRPEIPENEIFEDGGLLVMNTYKHFPAPRREGDPTPFLNHLSAMLPDPYDRQILLTYMACMVQFPGKKIPWTVLIQGVQGNGKSMIIRCMAHAIGERYSHRLNASDLAGNGLKFNAWIRNKLFIAIEEIYTADRRNISEALKTLITDERVEIQGKGQDQVPGDNRANFVMCSNHKDATPKDKKDRRYCIFYTAQQTDADMVAAGWKLPDGNSTPYFAKLYEWLNNGGYEIVTDYLYKFEILPALNPFTTLTTAPVTSSTNEAIERSLGGLEQEIYEAISEERSGFVFPWISSMALDRLIDARRDSKRFPRNRRKDILDEMGYITHPGLKNGRVNSIIPSEGGKPRLYVKHGHPVSQLTNHGEIINHYVKSQASAATGAAGSFAHNNLDISNVI